jgi:hypothetical protein
MQPKVKFTGAADDDIQMSSKLTRLEYPVCLAFSTIINKAQGQRLRE